LGWGGFTTRILEEWGADEKIVVLVNEFGEVGIDGVPPFNPNRVANTKAF